MNMISIKKRLTVLSVSIALFMDVLDTNIINTAIPTMARTFQVNPIDLKVALISYLLSLAIFIPISGWTADRYGTKRIFTYALGLFTLSSFFCGYAHSVFELVIARSIQGIGGAFMISLGRLIIVRTFKRHELMEVMNAVIIVVSVGVMLGPFVGGFITDHWSWPWIFWINVPAGILNILLAHYGLEDNTPRKCRPFDTLGFVLFGGGLAIFCFALSELSESNTSSTSIAMMILTATSMLIAYLIHAKFAVDPVINIKLFKVHTFRISVLGNLCARLGFGGMPFILPLMQQLALGLNPELSGLLLVPLAFGIIFSKLLASRVLRKVGFRRYLIVNTLLVGFVLWTYQLITKETPLYLIACLTFIFGIFIAAQYTAMNSLAFAEIHEDELSASTSITSTTQVLAQSLGVACAAILLRYFSSHFENTTTLTLATFHRVFFTLGLITFLSALVFVRLKPEDGKQMLRPPE